MSASLKIRTILPGLGLSIMVAITALFLERWAIQLTGDRWIDALVLSILIGTTIRSVLGMKMQFRSGIDFAAKGVLELAIVLLGATISIAALGEAGWLLVCVVMAIVCLSLLISYGIGRAFGLSDQLATLIACGNSICGNSAIVAAAPVIHAKSTDVAASIAFTAALGILVVVLLPLLQSKLGIDQHAYGILAGMTVYAVPQVVAATATVGAIALQVGTLVKLVRVLMLGPVIFLLGLKMGRGASEKLPKHRLVPWFVIGFALLLAMRSLGIIPDAILPRINGAATVLTLVAMAALGLSVDIRTVASSGGKVLAVGILSLIALGSISFLALSVLPLGV